MAKSNIRILAAVLASAMALSLTGCNDMFKKTETSSKENSSQTSKVNGEAVNKFGDNIAAKSENFTVSLPMIHRIFKSTYNDFTSYYASYYGFDTSKSSKVQFYDEENNITWYNQFIDTAKSNIKQLLTLCEAAKKDGMSLDDNDRKNVETNIENIRATADNAGQSIDEYISATFGEGLTEQDVRQNLEQTTLAQKYYQKLYNSFKYTDEDYEKTYNENKESYQYVDFLTFTFGYGTVDSSDSSVTVDEKQKETAKNAANELAKSKTEQEFNDYIRKYLSENHDYVNISSEESHTEEEYQTAIESQVNSAKMTKYAYEATTDAGKWLFASSRNVNDTYVFDGSSSYNVVMIIKNPYRDESINKNVRHILFTSDTYGSDANAKKKADEVYEEWKKGDATEESFAKLATTYNADSDSGSAANGGLYENVRQGQMVSEFNDWLFDETRKTGDTGIVKTTYGYHIMYYVGDSMPAWKSSVDAVLRRTDYNEKYKEVEDSITVEFDDDYINTIPDPVEEAENTAAQTSETSPVSEPASNAESNS